MLSKHFFCFNNLVFKEEMIGIFPLHLPLNFKLAVLSEVVLQTEATLPFFFFKEKDHVITGN